MMRRTAHFRKSMRASRARGFTLVELMVSLVAGLIVTIAVVGLARTATTTFYEQARISATESTVRSAAERLRQDLSRVAFMSTGNIQLARNDSPSVPAGQKISHVPGAATPSRYAETDDLQGIRIYSGGSYTTATSIDALSDLNSVKPDAIDITGNLTTDDSYRGKVDGNTVVLTGATDVAVARLLGNGPVGTAIRNAFTPGSTATPVPSFLARVVDPRGCQHYVVINGVTATATSAVISFANPRTGSPVLTPSQDGSTCGANEQEEVSISPIATAHWSIGATSPALIPDPAVEPNSNTKSDLYREIRDAAGNPLPAPGGPQVVAEYAVDLKFGVTVDDPTVGVVPPANHLVFDMDDNATDVALWTQQASLTRTGFPAPQRVRSVRFRITTRASLADRQDPLAPAVLGKPYYMTRYCVDSATPCKKFARTRTIMSEVALLNQQGMTY